MENKEVFNYPVLRIGAYLEKYGKKILGDKSTYKTEVEQSHLVRNNMLRGKLDCVKIGRETFVVMTERSRKLKKLVWKKPETQTPNPKEKSTVCKKDVMQIGEYIKSLNRTLVAGSVRYAMSKNYLDFVNVDGQLLVVMTDKTLAHKFGF